MADRLDALLEPGERVLFRARGAWVPSAVVALLGMVFALAGTGVTLMGNGAYYVLSEILPTLAGERAALWLEQFQALLLRGLAGYIAVSALFFGIAYYLYRQVRAEALVTDRRLLYRLAKRQAEIAEMPLDEIVAIQWHRPGPLGVTSRAGRTVSLQPLHKECQFATALATACGLGMPGRNGTADGLEGLLQPGEQVAYRARGEWIPSAFAALLGLVIALAGLGYALVHAGSYLVLLDILPALGGEEAMRRLEDGTVLLLQVLAGVAAYAAIFLGIAWYLYRKFGGEAFVTDRRLLYRPAKRGAETTEMPLDEIVAIQRDRSGRAGSLNVTSRSGRIVSLRPLHRVGSFAKELAAACGLGLPKCNGTAGEFEALLEPGERVLYRDPVPRLPRLDVPGLVFMACLTGMMWLYLARIVDDPTAPLLLPSLIATLLLVPCAIVYLIASLQLRATMTAVTDRRVIRRAGGPAPEFLDIPLADIAEVRCRVSGPGGALMIEDRRGHAILLQHLADPRALAARIAEASGARRGSVDGLLTWLGPLAIGPAALLCMVAILFVTGEVMGVLGLPVDGKGAKLAQALLAFVLSPFAGVYLGALAVIAALRPSVAPEEIHGAILASKRTPIGLGPWWSDLLMMWARVLYGPEKMAAREEGESHG